MTRGALMSTSVRGSCLNQRDDMMLRWRSILLHQLSLVPRRHAEEEDSLSRRAAMSRTTAEENSVPDAYQCSPATPRSCDGPSEETTTSAVLPIAAVARGHLHESGDFELPGGFCLNHAIADKLFPHQREGIAWMWSLHGSRIGISRMRRNCSRRLP